MLSTFSTLKLHCTICTNLTEEQCLNSVRDRDDRAIEVRSDDLFKMSSVSSEMWKGLEKNSQKHLGESRTHPRLVKFIEGACRKPSEWLDQSPHPKHLLPEQRHIHVNDLHILNAVQHHVVVHVLSDRLRSSSRSNKPPDSCLKGRDKTETCFSSYVDIRVHTADRQSMTKSCDSWDDPV